MLSGEAIILIVPVVLPLLPSKAERAPVPEALIESVPVTGIPGGSPFRRKLVLSGVAAMLIVPVGTPPVFVIVN